MGLDPELYFERKGAVALFVALDDQERRFSELEEEVRVSPSTLSNRLEEGRRLNLISESLVSAERTGTKKLYHLTAAGERIFEKMTDLGIPQAYTKMVGFQEHIDEQTETLLDWVDENQTMLAQEMSEDSHPDKRDPP